MRRLAARDPQVIRVDALWLAIEPLDMRTGTEAALERVVRVFCAARPHHAYLFANRRANRMKVLVHDGIGVWLAARRLHEGKLVWPKDSGSTLRRAGAGLGEQALTFFSELYAIEREVAELTQDERGRIRQEVTPGGRRPTALAHATAGARGFSYSQGNRLQPEALARAHAIHRRR